MVSSACTDGRTGRRARFEIKIVCRDTHYLYYTSIIPNNSHTRPSEMLPILRNAFVRHGSTVVTRAARPMFRTQRPYATAAQQGTSFKGDVPWIIGSLFFTIPAVCPPFNLLHSSIKSLPASASAYQRLQGWEVTFLNIACG